MEALDDGSLHGLEAGHAGRPNTPYARSFRSHTPMAKLKVLEQTPASLGYSFPPEWHRTPRTWFSWPRPEGISFPGKYHTVPENLARDHVRDPAREQVHINVPNENWECIVRQQLKEYGCPTRNVFFHHIKTNESWCRDHGPAFVLKPASADGKAAHGGDRGLGLQRVGREVSAVRRRRRRADARSPRS